MGLNLGPFALFYLWIKGGRKEKHVRRNVSNEPLFDPLELKSKQTKIHSFIQTRNCWSTNKGFSVIIVTIIGPGWPIQNTTII